MNDLSFRVLGPVRALRGGQPVDVAGGTVLSLLAGLLVWPNQILAVADLVRVVWDEEVPAHPGAALQSAVFRLRRLLGEDSVETAAGGYLVHARPETLDLLEFRRLMAAAHTEAAQGTERAAAAILDQAVALWRLPVLSNVSSVVLHRDVVPRLTDEYLDAHEERAQLYLRLGWHRRIVGDLADLVAAFPSREQLAGPLMVAMYRCGRQTDALTVYERLRRTQAEELGVDPSPRLRDLHMQILRGDLAAPGRQDAAPGALRAGMPHRVAGLMTEKAGVPRQLPPDIADFTGRTAELLLSRKLLTAAGKDQPSGGGRICILAGPGGVGKTALAVRTAYEVSGAYPDGQLYVDLQGAGGRPADPAEILSRFLRALGISGPGIPPGLEERSALFRSLAADRRMLVLLDNAAGEGQLRQLVPGGTSCGVIITSRSRITGLPGTHLIQLGMLEEAEAVELLGRVAGPGRISAEPAGARIVAGLTGGLPLALRIVGARLAVRPHWQLSTMAGRLADRRQRLGELRHGDLDVRASLALSYYGLPSTVRTMLRRIALLDAPDIPAWAGAALLDCRLGDAQELMDTLVDAYLLETAGNEIADRVRYRCHDLIRDYARELAGTEDPATEREAALTRVCGALLALTGHAHRQIYGGDYTILHGDARQWLAADMNPSRIVGSEPLTWLEGERLLITTAVRQGAELGLHEFCWDQAWIAVTLFEHRGYLDDWQTVQQQALAAARRAGNRRGEAAMLTSLGSRLIYQQNYGEARSLSELGAQIFAEIGDRHGHAIAQQKLGLTDAMNGRPEHALGRYEKAREAVREAGDRFVEMTLTREMARVHIDRGDFAAASRCLDEAESIGREVGSAYAESITTHMRGQLCLRQDQPVKAERIFGQALQLAQETRHLIGQLYARLGLAEALLGQGRARPAERQLNEVIDSAPRLRQQFLYARALLVLGQVQASLGEYGDAIRSLNSSIEIFRRCEIPMWQARAHDTLEVVRQASCNPGRPWKEASPA